MYGFPLSAAYASPPQIAPMAAQNVRTKRSWNVPPTRGCIMTQTVTTAHQLSFEFHHPRLCGSQAGTERRVVTRVTLKAKRDSKPWKSCTISHTRYRKGALFELLPWSYSCSFWSAPITGGCSAGASSKACPLAACLAAGI